MEKHPHIRIAHELWEAIAAGDVRALGLVLDEKCTWRMPGRGPLAGRYAGIEGVTTLMARAGELTDELTAELRDVFVSDQGVVMRFSLAVRRGTNRLDTEHLFCARIEDGRVTEGFFAPAEPDRSDRFWQVH